MGQRTHPGTTIRLAKPMKTAIPGRAHSERDVPFQTISGRPIERVYTRDAIPNFDYERELNDPGSYPYTRGIHPSGYRGKLWTMRQFSGYGAPEDTNRRYRELLAAGATGLSVAGPITGSRTD